MSISWILYTKFIANGTVGKWSGSLVRDSKVRAGNTIVACSSHRFLLPCVMATYFRLYTWLFCWRYRDLTNKLSVVSFSFFSENFFFFNIIISLCEICKARRSRPPYIVRIINFKQLIFTYIIGVIAYKKRISKENFSFGKLRK